MRPTCAQCAQDAPTDDDRHVSVGPGCDHELASANHAGQFRPRRSVPLKVRVYELALELGMDSRRLMAMLNEMGEFVRSASSTVEPAVVHEVRRTVAADKPAPALPAWAVITQPTESEQASADAVAIFGEAARPKRSTPKRSLE